MPCVVLLPLMVGSPAMAGCRRLNGLSATFTAWQISKNFEAGAHGWATLAQKKVPRTSSPGFPPSHCPSKLTAKTYDKKPIKMATKAGKMEKKRKADTSSKPKSADSGVKKARMDDASKKSAKPPKHVEEEEDDFESFSDSEDGGAPLERSHKFDANKNGDNANSKAFERGKFNCSSRMALSV
jgi:hypothetical protein